MSRPKRKTKIKTHSQIDHFTKMIRVTMETSAWRALSSTAQALYPWLKLEWRGPANNNNGRISLAVSTAARLLGVKPDTAARAFRDLQAKGFLVMTKPACLGIGGAAAAPWFELTEIALPHAEKPEGRKLYREWREDKDFTVNKAQPHNPRGINRKQNPIPKIGMASSRKGGWIEAEPSPFLGSVIPENGIEKAASDPTVIPISGISLPTIPSAAGRSRASSPEQGGAKRASGGGRCGVGEVLARANPDPEAQQ
jgi:hypothetical protein